MGTLTDYSARKQITEPALLEKKLHYWRLHAQRVVFTNGVFDLLHPGHVDYLERARELGHCLVVGINDDASVARLKPGRPYQTLAARMRVLAGLIAVDAVVSFSEDTPLELIRAVRPDVLVKGADYTVQTIVGADLVLGYGGQVLTLELVPGYSTTALAQRLAL